MALATSPSLSDVVLALLADSLSSSAAWSAGLEESLRAGVEDMEVVVVVVGGGGLLMVVIEGFMVPTRIARAWQCGVKSEGERN